MPVKELYQNTYMISLRHGLHGLLVLEGWEEILTADRHTS